MLKVSRIVSITIVRVKQTLEIIMAVITAILVSVSLVVIAYAMIKVFGDL